MKGLQAGRGRYPQRRAQSDGQGEPAGRRRERGLSRSESARSVKAGGISPGIREDGAGRGLLRGAPTRPLARPRAGAPLKLPEAWRAEPLRCRALPHPAPRCLAQIERRFRSPSAAAAACAPARRPGRGRLAAPSALPGPAPAPSAAARFPRSRPLPWDRALFAPAQRALSPTSCRLIPEPCPHSADPDGASPGC